MKNESVSPGDAEERDLLAAKYKTITRFDSLISCLRDGWNTWVRTTQIGSVTSVLTTKTGLYNLVTAFRSGHSNKSFYEFCMSDADVDVTYDVNILSLS